jgi:serine protease
MIRRLAILGLLGLTSACTLFEPEPEPEPSRPSGTVKGSLTPFRIQSAPPETGWPAQLRDAGVRRQLSQSISNALAAKQGVQRAELTRDPAGDADAVPGDVIVRFEQAHLSEAAALARVHLPGYRAVYKGSLSEHLHLIGYESLEKRSMKPGETGDLARQVGKLHGVRYAEKNARVQAFKTPDDPGYSSQWHYPMMNLPAAWDITTGSNSVVVVVAVLDTGIVKHPDLDNRVLPGADLVADAASAGDGDGRDTDPTDMGQD